MNKSRLWYTLRDLLIGKGYEEFANDENLMSSAVEYIEMQDEDYTPMQWIDDTEFNYPRFLYCEDEGE